jgi:amino acid adenylation domain-containing protein
MIEGDVQLPLLQQAWQTVIARNAVLRTVFVGEGEQQHQLVVKRVSLPWYEEDLRSLTAEEQSARFEEYREADRARGFAPAEAPLMRLSLFRLKDDVYRLLWSHHHTLLDGWSISLVYGEVMQTYAALNEGLRSPLPPVAEYARYIEWLQAQDSEKARRYWQTYLADVETVTPLPYDTQLGQQQTNHQMQEASLSAADTAQLSALAKTYHTTVNTLLQLAWGIVLQRYSNEKTVVFGSVISGRLAEVAEIERIVGLCINSIPVVLSSDGNESLADAIARLQSSFRQSQGYGYLPLMEIKKQSRLSGATPLFETLLAFERYALDLTMATPDRAGSVRMGEFGAYLQDTFPITLSLWQHESIQVTCKYFADRFSATTIARMLDHFIRVLQQLPTCRTLTDINLLTEAETAHVQAAAHGPRVEYPRAGFIHKSFEAQAELRPEAVALVFGDRQLSYRELNDQANQLAHYLQSRGVGPETIVGICLERSLEMIVSLLGVLKAGAAYLPLDPDYPPERLSFMLADAAVPVLLTATHLKERLALEAAAVICLDTEWEKIAEHSSENAVTNVSGENLAYVIYTSGSTGKPKGAMNSHTAIYNRLCWMQEAYRLTPADHVLQKTPYSFDVSVWEFFWPLMTGARLVVARPGGHRDSAYLVELIKQEQVTTLHFVPAMLHVFLAEAGVETCTSLRRVICSGEALSRELQDRFFTRLPEVELHNLYGPTEAAVDVTCWACDAASKHSTVPIGRPIANTQIYLVDKHHQLVPVGVPGELYIGGVQLARGYHKRAELTAERFVPDPFSSVPGARLYRTGDLARYLSDGSIEYLGRLDFQVKIRGFRIELGEIEAVLGEHPAVSEAVVLARADVRDEKRLVAYLLLDGDERPTNTELRDALKAHLPEYMVPAQFVMLKEFPVTPNGKVDRRALAALERAGEESEAGYLAPRTPEEELLAGIWAEVLGVQLVSVNDNFFERGGHSLLATQVVSQVRALFGIELPLRALFDTATLADLSQVIVARRQAEAVGIGAITRRTRETAPALSYAQQRLWFLDQFEPQSAVYNVPASIYLTGELDHAALAQSLSEIVRRHEVLRTSFPNVGGQPVQLIAPPAPVDLPVTDLQALTEQEREILASRYSTTQKVKH